MFWIRTACPNDFGGIIANFRKINEMFRVAEGVDHAGQKFPQ